MYLEFPEFIQIKARIFLLLVDLITKPPSVIFRKVEKKIISKIILFYPPTLNIICFVEKFFKFLRFCLCIFESDTVENNCPSYAGKYEISKDLIQTVSLLYQFYCLFRILKKKKALNLFIFFVQPTLNLKKNPVNQLIKKNLALN